MSDEFFKRTEEEKRIDAIILSRVKAGIAWLEETEGPDWVDRIDLRKLDLQSGSACICGQVFEKKIAPDGCSYKSLDGYGYACEVLRVPNSGEDYGFSVDQLENETEQDDLWERLQDTWVQELTPLVHKHLHGS